MEGGGRWFEAEAAGAGEAGVEVEEEVDRGPMAGEEEDSKGGDPERRAADHGDQVLKVGWWHDCSMSIPCAARRSSIATLV